MAVARDTYSYQVIQVGPSFNDLCVHILKDSQTEYILKSCVMTSESELLSLQEGGGCMDYSMLAKEELGSCRRTSAY